jgi:hypothetical protein
MEKRLSIDKELRILWKLCLGLEENVKSVKKYVKRVETARYQQKNTQPQAGEYPQKAKYISGEVPEEKKTLVQLRRVFDKKRVKEWDRIAMETYKQATQSTPEQKEEWEKKWEEFFLYVTNNKNWVDGRPEWKGNVYITLYNAMKDFIRQLLEEREREVLNSMREWVVEYHKDNWDIRDFDAEIAIGKIIDRELSKLSKKK